MSVCLGCRKQRTDPGSNSSSVLSPRAAGCGLEAGGPPWVGPAPPETSPGRVDTVFCVLMCPSLCVSVFPSLLLMGTPVRSGRNPPYDLVVTESPLPPSAVAF